MSSASSDGVVIQQCDSIGADSLCACCLSPDRSALQRIRRRNFSTSAKEAHQALSILSEDRYGVDSASQLSSLTLLHPSSVFPSPWLWLAADRSPLALTLGHSKDNALALISAPTSTLPPRSPFAHFSSARNAHLPPLAACSLTRPTRTAPRTALTSRTAQDPTVLTRMWRLIGTQRCASRSWSSGGARRATSAS